MDLPQNGPADREDGVVRTEIDAGPGEADADADAVLASFVAAEGARLVQFAFLLTRDPHDAQDLAQTVLYRLTRRGIADLDDPVGYARRCLINEHRSGLRRLRIRVTALARLQPDDPVVPDPAAQVSATRVTLAALNALTPRQREAVVLRYWGDLPDDEIAAILSCAPATVRSLLSRAMPVLRTALDDTEVDR